MNKLKQLISKSALATAVACVLSATVVLADGAGSGSTSTSCGGQTSGACVGMANHSCIKVTKTVGGSTYEYYACCTQQAVNDGTC